MTVQDLSPKVDCQLSLNTLFIDALLSWSILCNSTWGGIYIYIYLGAKPSDGVPDMTAISEIDEYGINENLRVRYRQDKIYVSSSTS